MMDWFNTNFYRTFGYGLVYPQILDYCRLEDDAANQLQIAAGKTGAERFLKTLNDQFLGAGAPWLCGETLALADYFASGLVSVGETMGCTFAAYPNIQAWYGRIKALPNWQSANGGLYEWVKFIEGPEYVTV